LSKPIRPTAAVPQRPLPARLEVELLLDGRVPALADREEAARRRRKPLRSLAKVRQEDDVRVRKAEKRMACSLACVREHAVEQRRPLLASAHLCTVQQPELRRRLRDPGVVAVDDHLDVGSEGEPAPDRVALHAAGRLLERLRDREERDHAASSSTSAASALTLSS
jgi:hypothetical protein